MAIKISGSTIIDDSRNIVAGAAATFTGDVSIGGTLTYEDVTNIDSLGIVTAREGIRVTGDAKTITLGASNDFSLQFDGTNSIVAAPTSGELSIRGQVIELRRSDLDEPYLRGTEQAAV